MGPESTLNRTDQAGHRPSSEDGSLDKREGSDLRLVDASDQRTNPRDGPHDSQTRSNITLPVPPDPAQVHTERIALQELQPSIMERINNLTEKVEKLLEVYRLSIESRFACANTFEWEGKYCMFPKELATHVFRVEGSILLHRRDAVKPLYSLL